MNPDLRHLAAPLFRRKRVSMLTFLSAFLLAALLGWMRLHRYESHMVISFSRGHPDPQHTAGAVNAEAMSLKDRDLLQEVVIANGMQNTYEWGLLNYLPPRLAGTDRVARAVRSLSAQIEVETSSKPNRIAVTYSSPDPDLAYRVLNSLASLYMQKHAVPHRRAGSDQSLTPQTESYKAALEDADAGLRAIGLSHAVPDPAGQRTLPAVPSTGAKAQSQVPEQAQTLKLETPFNDADLEREAKEDEKNYLLYLSRREQQRTSDAQETTQIESVAIAVPPQKAVAMHSPATILLAAFVWASLTSFLITYITDYFDPSFHTPAQMIDILGIPVVVAVPKRTA